MLVADDVADTGHTLRLVREVLAQHVAEARTAVLYRKPRSVVAPDYAWQETDRWIVFPWSAEPPVTTAAPPCGVTHVTGDRGKRLLADLEALAEVGDTGDGGNCRLALTDEDAGGRELVVGWMRDLGLDVAGRPHRQRRRHPGRAPTPRLDPVMTGSHIDTVRTGGRYDGTLGVLAGLEVVRALDDAGVRTRRPLAVAFFTDEEGSRFAPDMLGSLVYVGGLPLEDALDVVGIDGAVLGDELERIGWAGDAAVPGPAPARLRRAAHRAGPGAGGAGRHHRRRHRGAGHLLAGADAHRPVQPRRHHADAAAPRRRLRRGRGRHVRAATSPTSSAATRSAPSAGSTSTPTWSTSWRPGRR